MRSLICLAVVSSSLIACGGGQSQRTRDSRTAAALPSASAATPSPSSSKEVCPATGQWSECEVFKALDRAGLAPRRDSTTAAVVLAPLNESGTRFLLGGAQLDVFVYPNAAARERDEARLDRTKFIEASDEPTLRGEATLIRNVNLLAILRSRNDHQRERVSDALSAGPPQASGGTSLPSTHVRR